MVLCICCLYRYKLLLYKERNPAEIQDTKLYLFWLCDGSTYLCWTFRCSGQCVGGEVLCSPESYVTLLLLYCFFFLVPYGNKTLEYFGLRPFTLKPLTALEPHVFIKPSFITLVFLG